MDVPVEADRSKAPGYATKGIQLWIDHATSERHVYAVFADRVERWPRPIR